METCMDHHENVPKPQATLGSHGVWKTTAYIFLRKTVPYYSSPKRPNRLYDASSQLSGYRGPFPRA